MWEKTTPSTELPRVFCAGIGPLQLGVVLVISIINFINIWLLENRYTATYNKFTTPHHAQIYGTSYIDHIMVTFKLHNVNDWPEHY